VGIEVDGGSGGQQGGQGGSEHRGAKEWGHPDILL
jgi:hypothetical protein